MTGEYIDNPTAALKRNILKSFTASAPSGGAEIPENYVQYLKDAAAFKRANNAAIDCVKNAGWLRTLFGACSVENKAAADSFKKEEESFTKLYQLPSWFTKGM